MCYTTKKLNIISDGFGGKHITQIWYIQLTSEPYTTLYGFSMLDNHSWNATAKVSPSMPVVGFGELACNLFNHRLVVCVHSTSLTK